MIRLGPVFRLGKARAGLAEDEAGESQCAKCKERGGLFHP